MLRCDRGIFPTGVVVGLVRQLGVDTQSGFANFKNFVHHMGIRRDAGIADRVGRLFHVFAQPASLFFSLFFCVGTELRDDPGFSLREKLVRACGLFPLSSICSKSVSSIPSIA